MWGLIQYCRLRVSTQSSQVNAQGINYCCRWLIRATYTVLYTPQHTNAVYGFNTMLRSLPAKCKAKVWPILLKGKNDLFAIPFISQVEHFLSLPAQTAYEPPACMPFELGNLGLSFTSVVAPASRYSAQQKASTSLPQILQTRLPWFKKRSPGVGHPPVEDVGLACQRQ